MIISIEGNDTRDLSLDAIVDALRGEPGTPVRITIAHRVGGKKRDVSIVREIIEIKSVSLVEVIGEKSAISACARLVFQREPQKKWNRPCET